MFIFSATSRLLVVRGMFFVLALAGIWGIWHGREFTALFPFGLQTAADFLFIIALFFFAWRLPSLLPLQRKVVLAAFFTMLVYSVLSNVANVLTYINAIGLSQAAKRADLSSPVYLFSEFAITTLIPAFVFGFVIWIVYSVHK